MYGQFVKAVADGRHAKVEDIKAVADGRVWTGEQALSMHMIDQIADFEAAVDDTAKAVGITGKPVLVHPDKDRKTVLDLLFGDVSAVAAHPGKADGPAHRVLLFVEVDPRDYRLGDGCGRILGRARQPRAAKRRKSKAQGASPG